MSEVVDPILDLGEGLAGGAKDIFETSTGKKRRDAKKRAEELREKEQERQADLEKERKEREEQEAAELKAEEEIYLRSFYE